MTDDNNTTTTDGGAGEANMGRLLQFPLSRRDAYAPMGDVPISAELISLARSAKRPEAIREVEASVRASRTRQGLTW